MRSGIFAALLWPALATAAGHPDLSGNWEGVTGSTSAVSYPTAAAPGGSINAGMMSPELAAVALKQMQETGAGKAASALRGMQSQPQFRTPELARRAEELWQNGSGSDAVVASRSEWRGKGQGKGAGTMTLISRHHVDRSHRNS